MNNAGDEIRTRFAGRFRQIKIWVMNGVIANRGPGSLVGLGA
jgi:hypothetical protein